MKIKYALFVFGLSLLVLVPNKHKVQAAPTFTSAETVANVVGVSEVHASTTLTVASAIASSTSGTTASQITVGNCVITFATTTGGTARVGASVITADEANCSDNTAIILLATTTNDTALSTTLLAQEIRGLKNVIDSNHGALAVAGSGTNISFTSTSTETTATNITISTSTGNAISNSITKNTPTTSVIPVTAVAQTVTFTPVYTNGYIYTVTIDGTDYSYTSSADTYDLRGLVENIKGALSSAASVTCTEDDAIVTCVAASAGTTFTYGSSVTAATVTNNTSSNTGGHRSGGGGGRVSVSTSITPPKIEVTGPTGFVFTRALGFGLISNDVKMLQERLLSEGLFEGEVTGYFGPITVAAVKAYQAKYGIDQLGIVGPLTMTQLNKNNFASASQLTSAQVSEIMSRISALLQQIEELKIKIKALNN